MIFYFFQKTVANRKLAVPVPAMAEDCNSDSDVVIDEEGSQTDTNLPKNENGWSNTKVTHILGNVVFSTYYHFYDHKCHNNVTIILSVAETSSNTF